MLSPAAGRTPATVPSAIAPGQRLLIEVVAVDPWGDELAVRVVAGIRGLTQKFWISRSAVHALLDDPPPVTSR